MEQRSQLYLTGRSPNFKAPSNDGAYLMKNPSYPYHYAPEAFKDYRPSAGEKDNLSQQDMGKLCGYVRDVLDAEGEAALILIWRFAFGVDCNTIRFYSKAEKSVNGVCEAFRYGCQRFLERQDTISNASLKRVFRMALHDYDIVLLHRQKGVTWLSRNYFESGISIKEIMRCYQQKQFIRLNSTSVSPTECRTLREGDIIRLSRHILNLPVEYSGILLLRY